MSSKVRMVAEQDYTDLLLVFYGVEFLKGKPLLSWLPMDGSHAGPDSARVSFGTNSRTSRPVVGGVYKVACRLDAEGKLLQIISGGPRQPVFQSMYTDAERVSRWQLRQRTDDTLHNLNTMVEQMEREGKSEADKRFGKLTLSEVRERWRMQVTRTRADAMLAVVIGYITKR